MAQNTKYNGVLYKLSRLTEEIIGAFFTVYYALGHGFLEKVYAKPEQKRCSFDNNRKEWWLAQNRS